MTTCTILNIDHRNLNTFLNDAKVMLTNRINAILQTKNAINVNTILAVDFKIETKDSIEMKTKFFSDGSFEILQSSLLNEILTDNFETLQTNMEESQLRGSGWSLIEIIHLEVHVNEYIALRGGDSTFMDMPLWIQQTHSVVNIYYNNDDRCFLWSVLAALHPLKKCLSCNSIL